MGLKGIFKNSYIILCSEVKAIFALFCLGKQAELGSKRELMEITFSFLIHNEDTYFVFFHEMVRQVQPQQETEENQENKVDYIHRPERQKAQHNIHSHIGKTAGW